MMNNQIITVSTKVKAGIQQVWIFFTEPVHIRQWNQASPEWHTPAAVNDLREGGRFCYTMAARDGSAFFDFSGTYTNVVQQREISYRTDDGRMVTVTFTPEEDGVSVTEQFEPEQVHSRELQQAGWQAILDSFRAYAVSARL